MRIPDDKIDEIRSATNIVDLISDYVTLKQRGKNYFGLCPFHHEKTPSFSVNPGKGIFHCFGCSEGGNVYTFLMKHEKISFYEAVVFLAERANIPLPTASQDPDKASEFEAFYHAAKFAARFFYKNIIEHEEGDIARHYLEAREFNNKTNRKFGIGYSLDEWEGLIQHARQHHVKIESLSKTGLVIERKTGKGFYDRFRGRLMFPIINLSGRVVGFGARRLQEDDDTPKYINSPETEIYHKSKILYGLYQGRSAIRHNDNVLLVEGYTDVMRLHQTGIENVVATSGTALAEDQARILSRYTKNVTIVYDSDSAGSKAAIRGADIFIEQGLNVQIVQLPQGSDPDSFVQKEGTDVFRQLVDQAISFIDFKLQLFEKSGYLDSPTEQAKAIRSVMKTISKIGDEIQRNILTKQVSDKMNIPEGLLAKEMMKQRRQRYSQPEKTVKSKEEKKETKDETTYISARSIKIQLAERDLVKMLISGDNTVRTIIIQNLSLSDLHSDKMRKFIEHILHMMEQGQEINFPSLINAVEDEEIQKFISQAAVENADDVYGSEKLAADCLLTIRENRLEEKLNDLKKNMKTDPGNSSLIKEYNQLMQQLKEIQSKRTSSKS